MKAVVMAGGKGTRLRPITETLPKPFVSVAGKPCIEYVISALADAGATDVVLTTFYKPWQLMERLMGGTRLGVRAFYSIEDEALGTAGGVKKAQSLLDDTFIVASGDVLADVDIASLVRFHRERGAVATMALTEVPWDAVSEFGVVDVDEEGRITRFQEKPSREEAFSNLINTGIYVLEPEALDRVPDGEKFDFSKQLFPTLLEEGAGLYAKPLDGLWMDLGRPDDLIEASILMAERRHGGVYREGATVHAEAEVRRSCLYPDSRVDRQGVVEESILYAGAAVETGARVRRSVVCEGAVVAEGATVEGSVIGAGARVGPKATVRGERVEPDATVA